MGMTVKASLALFILACNISALDSAAAQTYPSKPGRFIVGVAAGGGTDVSARIVASRLSEMWGQTLVVDNRPGAGTTIGAEIAAKAVPDGYTLLLCAAASHGIAPHLYKKLGYNHIKDFSPISLIGTTPNVLVVHPSLPAKSVSEFITHAKANPGKINFASAGVGTSPHMTMELFRLTTGINIVHIPYKGGAPALAELLGGHIQAMFDNLSTQLSTIKAGRVRALAVTSSKRSTYIPDVPTMIESGISRFEVTVWYGICAPSGVPSPIIAKLNADVVNVLNMQDVRQRLAEVGVDAESSTPGQFATFINSESAKWAKVVRDAGVTIEQ
jgi:tripartite-type tricarboxylate transporter receptor subunit TctC